MQRLNLSKVKREERTLTKAYTAFGERVFQKALEEQAENYTQFNPQIMEDAYLRFYERVFVDAARRGLKTVRLTNQKNLIPESFFLASWRAWIRDYVLNDIVMQALITAVNERTLKEIALALSEGIQNGVQLDRMASWIKKLVGSKSRALGIAITESTRANALGKERSAEDWQRETGQELWKLWVHSQNRREPRLNHIALQNKPIPKENPFENGLIRPGDPSGPASETVRCQCTLVFISRDYVSRYYPKFLS